MICWVICKNRLRIGFRNEFLRFISDQKVDLDVLYILKITFKNSLELVWRMSHSISHKNFPQDFPQDFPATFSRKILPQDFPTRFSRKISLQDFLQDFPATISCKIFRKFFPQVFPKLDPDWLAPHHPISNAKFPPITAFLKLAFSPPPFPARFSCNNFRQDLPATISGKIFPQDFPARFSHKNFPENFPARISCKIFPSWILIGWLPITLFQMLNFHQSLHFLNSLFSLLHFLQDFPATISHKIFLQQFSAGFSHKNFPQVFPARFSHKISHKIFLSWILIGWLPITLVQMPNFHQSLPC